jgi:hypothetical protein
MVPNCVLGVIVTILDLIYLTPTRLCLKTHCSELILRNQNPYLPQKVLLHHKVFLELGLFIIYSSHYYDNDDDDDDISNGHFNSRVCFTVIFILIDVNISKF